MATMTQDRRPPRRPTRPAPKKPEVLTGPIDVDTETSAALILFAARHAALADQERDARRVEKAGKAKDEAAARVRNLENDTKATAEQRTEAAGAYRSAVEAWERAKSGEPATAEDAAAATEDSAEDSATQDSAEDSAADEADSDAVEAEAPAITEAVEVEAVEADAAVTKAAEDSATGAPAIAERETGEDSAVAED
jgi:hypothetical protein